MDETRDIPTRRRAVLLVDGDAFLTLFKAGHREYRVTEHALPEDARFVGGQVDGDRLRILVESASFEPVPINVPLPILPPPVAVRDRDALVERSEQEQASLYLYPSHEHDWVQRGRTSYACADPSCSAVKAVE